MLRKINISQLRVGMYVEHVDKDWFNIPFFRRKITSEEQIEKLRRYHVEEVKIDLTRGIDVGGDQPETTVAVAEPPQEPEESPKAEPRDRSVMSREFREELEPAKRAYRQALKAVRDVMQDSRSGRYLEQEQTKVVVAELVDSCMRNDDALVSLTKLLSHDEYTFSHCINVTVFTLVLGKALGFAVEDLQSFGESVMLHDVGKMLVPPEILNKPGKLTPEEFDVMKLHVDRGVALLQESFPDNRRIALVAEEHHERMDGSGYPHGKRGNDISQWGQISAIADVYDALTSRRCYKREITPHRSMALIYRLRGGDFNPLYVDRFIECVGIYPIGSLVRLTTGEVALVVSIRHDDLLHPDVLVLYRNGHRLLRPKVLDLSERGANDRFLREVEDILDPEEYGVDPAAHIIEE
ncbi:HD-GYP domain-containing protein [Candidatus Sumerlaeota bacterium]|nr:HD-GYP domain-containing protein [Candidatus Sumerlaeota bacterium]